MCGIVGMFSKKCVNSNSVLNAFKSLSHRGSNSTAVFRDKDICLGHCRLAVIDLSPNGNQPMIYKNKAVVVDNGEIYNFIELRDDSLLSLEIQELGVGWKAKLLDSNGIIYELFEPDGIKWMIRKHLRRYDHTKRLWELLFLVEWLEEKFHKAKN